MGSDSFSIIPEIAANLAELSRFRRDIHAHPELSYTEHRTSQKVAEQLTALGIEVHTGIAKTGLVGVLKAGTSPKTIGLRADMDALPIQELNRFSHASTIDGKMHACGHDGHTTMLLGAAKYLAQHPHFDGTVYLIFQPAEEGGAGAKTMIDEGLFTRFPIDAVFGLHNWPSPEGVPAGAFFISKGPVMASANSFAIKINGKGGHAALPHLSVDPLPGACQLVLALQTIVSRNITPIEAAVISVTKIEAGTASNIIPDDCTISGTIRTFSLGNLTLINKRIEEICQGFAQSYQLSIEFIQNDGYPPTINSETETDFARQVMTSVVGATHILEQTPTMGAEDFSFMLQEKPGCYGFISNGNGSHRLVDHGTGPCFLHNACYDFNDEIITVGASYFARLVEAWLPATSKIA